MDILDLEDFTWKPDSTDMGFSLFGMESVQYERALEDTFVLVGGEDGNSGALSGVARKFDPDRMAFVEEGEIVLDQGRVDLGAIFVPEETVNCK